MVFASPRREVSVDFSLRHFGDIGLAGEAGVAGDFLEFAAQIGLGLIDQGDQRAVVGGIGRQSLGDDDLVSGIDGDLAVEADDVAVVGGLNAAVAVDGRLVMPTGMMIAMQGRRGDTILVNGAPTPLARVRNRLVRLRLVNGSNARIYELSFSDGRVSHWIAAEGGLLERPAELQAITLAPGQRAEVLVYFADGKSVSLVTGADSNSSMMGDMMGSAAGGTSGLGASDGAALRTPGDGPSPSQYFRHKASPLAHAPRCEQGRPASSLSAEHGYGRHDGIGWRNGADDQWEALRHEPH